MTGRCASSRFRDSDEVTIGRVTESLYTDVMGDSSSRQRNRAAATSAAQSTDKLKRLLERIALVTRPSGGGAVVLFALGRIASSSRWLDDAFSVEITGDDVDSMLEIYVERKRVVSPTTFAIPVTELIETLDADPTLVGSLRFHVEPRKLLLTTTRVSGEVRVT